MSEGQGSLLRRMRAVWDSLPALVVLTQGPDHVVVYQNLESARLFGDRQLGRPMTQAFPEFSGEGRRAIDAVFAQGVVIVEEVPRPGVLGRHGSEVLLTYVFAPVLDADAGTPTGVVLTAFDVTSEVSARRLARQTALLGELSEQMNAAADPGSVVQALADGLVPVVADLAAIFVLPHGRGGSSRAARPEAQISALAISEALLDTVGAPPRPAAGGRPTPWDGALAQGRPQLIDVRGPELAGQSDPAVMAWLSRAAVHTMALLPLALAGRLVGAVVLLAAGDRDPYLDEDLAFLEILAARAGAAVSHLQVIAREREVALELQHALLPAAPTGLRGLEVAARYRAGTAGVEIGGDWWDVHQLDETTAGLGVGDVGGHGIHAAAVMGQLRAAMRAAALAGVAPGRILTLLDEQLFGLSEAPSLAVAARLATAVYATVDLDSDTVRVANAGHPPLLLRTTDGTVRWVHAPPGPPLGTHLPAYEEITAPFGPGDLLVGCTDGLLESRTQGIQTGLDLLSTYLEGLAGDATVDEIADGVLDWMARVPSGDDDIALVVLRRS